VLGTFNGRAITQADSDRLSGALPTATGPVEMGPNGSFAAATGARPATPSATGIAAAPAAAPALPRPVGAVIDNRSASVPEDEMRRRLSIALATDGRGSPDTRRALTAGFEAEMGRRAGAEEASANRNARLTEQAQAGTIAAQNLQQQQTFQASQRNAELAQQESQFGRTLASNERLAVMPRPQLITDASGKTFSVGAGGATAVTDKDGNPIQQAVSKESGQITPAMQFAAINEQIKAVTESMLPPEERAAQLSALQQRQAALVNGGQGAAPSAAPTLDDFLTKARAANPGASDAQLRAYYDKTYGGK